MQVTFQNGVFVCRCTFEDRLIAKEAGFRWDNTNKKWFTKSVSTATKLSGYMDSSALNQIDKIQPQKWTGELSIPKGEELYDFQIKSAEFILSKNRSYLGLDPGLGKTPIAAVMAQTLFDYCKAGVQAAIYICPPFLTRNVQEEFQKWAPRLLIARREPGKTTPKNWHILIIPDSIINRSDVQMHIKQAVDVMHKLNMITLLFVDEAHRFKNDDAMRTKALFGTTNTPGIADLFDRIVYMSGTPMPNRPIELFPVLSHSAPETIDHMNKFEYAQKYCAAYQNQWGWDFSGSSNIEELSRRVKGSFMLRYRKSEVLKELPEKIEEMVVLNETLPPRMVKLSKNILHSVKTDDLIKGRIEVDLGVENLHLSTYRRELGCIKAEAAAEFIKFILEETDEAVLVFAIHKEVICILDRELSKWSPLCVTGDTRMELRHEYVKQFQQDPKRRLFIGNIQAAGTGLTLTKASRVVFAEFSWVPGDNDQASDRAHRIGQDSNVVVQYLVLEHSVDKAVISTVLEKKRITEKL